MLERDVVFDVVFFPATCACVLFQSRSLYVQYAPKVTAQLYFEHGGKHGGDQLRAEIWRTNRGVVTKIIYI